LTLAAGLSVPATAQSGFAATQAVAADNNLFSPAVSDSWSAYFRYDKSWVVA